MMVFIFIMGFLVTLVVVGAISLLIWGAILDGRTEEERKRRLSVAGGGAASRRGSSAA